MPQQDEGTLHASGTAGKRVRGAVLAFMVLYLAATLWARYTPTGSSEIIGILQVLLPVAVAALVVHCYLVLAPAVAKFRWALGNRSGTSAEYREHREAADLAAIGKARTGAGRWIIGLRRGTW